MDKYKNLPLHPMSENLVKILMKKTGNQDPMFFRIMNVYYMSLMASQMRCTIKGFGKTDIPINNYVINLSPSGTGKGYSTSFFENNLLTGFKEVFINHTFPSITAEHLEELANKRSRRNGTTIDYEIESLEKEFDALGSFLFDFDSATVPAIKQHRHKLLLSNIGSLNYKVDECYTPDVEVLTEQGFIPFSKLPESLKVAQYNATTNNITFTNPTRHIKKEYSGEVYNFSTPTGFDFSVTPKHEVLVWNKTKGYHKTTPDLINTSHCIPLTGMAINTSNSFVMTDALKLSIAVQADGCIRKHGTVELSFTKQRKILEMESLLSRLNLNHNKYNTSNGYTTFSIKAIDAKPFKFSKDLNDFMPNITELNYLDCRELLNELVKWDGSINKNITNIHRYTCKHLYNVEYVQSIAVLAGYRSKLYSNNKEGYEGGYYVSWNINGSNKAHLPNLYKESTTGKKILTIEQYEGYVYCVEVPDTNIIIRRNGVVSIGGNCGANLNSQEEILHTFLELYDLGMLKEKLIKSSAENKRHERLDGVSPANMLLFGTPTKLFDGGRTEAAFYELLDMGYARRCFYGLSKEVVKDENLTAEQMVDAMFDNIVDDAYIDDLNNKFMLLAHEANANKSVIIDRNELVYLMEYRLKCESKAAEYPEQQSVQAAELSHRYFKALKLAGVYAFIEDNIYITKTNLENAIALTELSGIAFEELMKPEKSYMKLANYLAESPTEVTLADLIEDLAFFKGTKAQKEELIALATAYGYKNNIIIKASKENGILFLKGESLQLTNRDELLISLSNHEAYNYDTKKVTFDDLTDLGDATGYHWCNHSFEGGHRRETSVLPGFNLLVLDVDNGMSIKSVQEVLKNYDHVIYTTKSHTQTNNSFRILLPTNYILYLDKEEYKKFINNILEVLPFEVDTASNQRSKKWLTHEGNTYVNDVGNLFDVLPYIPQTTKNEQRITTLMDSDMDRLEAWLINNTEDGNRNTQLYNYACILLDNGESYVDIRNKVLSLNSKLSDSLSEEEVDNTVLRSISTKVLTE